MREYTIKISNEEEYFFFNTLLDKILEEDKLAGYIVDEPDNIIRIFGLLSNQKEINEILKSFRKEILKYIKNDNGYLKFAEENDLRFLNATYILKLKKIIFFNKVRQILEDKNNIIEYKLFLTLLSRVKHQALSMFPFNDFFEDEHEPNRVSLSIDFCLNQFFYNQAFTLDYNEENKEMLPKIKPAEINGDMYNKDYLYRNMLNPGIFYRYKPCDDKIFLETYKLTKNKLEFLSSMPYGAPDDFFTSCKTSNEMLSYENDDIARYIDEKIKGKDINYRRRTVKIAFNVLSKYATKMEIGPKVIRKILGLFINSLGLVDPIKKKIYNDDGKFLNYLHDTVLNDLKRV